MNYDLPLYTSKLKRRPSIKNAQRLQDAFQHMQNLTKIAGDRADYYKGLNKELEAGRRDLIATHETTVMQLGDRMSDMNSDLAALGHKNSELVGKNALLKSQLEAITGDRANYKSKWEAAKELLSQVLAGTRNGV